MKYRREINQELFLEQHFSKGSKIYLEALEQLDPDLQNEYDRACCMSRTIMHALHQDAEISEGLLQDYNESKMTESTLMATAMFLLGAKYTDEIYGQKSIL